jgi:hypothetical protein
MPQDKKMSQQCTQISCVTSHSYIKLGLGCKKKYSKSFHFIRGISRKVETESIIFIGKLYLQRQILF